MQPAFASAPHAEENAEEIFIGHGAGSTIDTATGSSYDSSKEEAPDSGKSYDKIYGGKVTEGDGNGREVTQNKLKLESGHAVNDKGEIYGGYYGSDGTLAVSNGEITVKTTYNSVEIDASALGDAAAVYGGSNYFADAQAKATGDASYYYQNRYYHKSPTGGTESAAYTIDASYNSVTLSGSAAAGDIYGGRNYLAAATATATASAYAYAYGEAIGGCIGGTATAGTGTITFTIEAEHNSVTLSGDAQANNIYGGCNYFASASAAANADAKADAFCGGSESTIAATGKRAQGGTATAGTASATYNIKASHNKDITLSDNAQASDIYGGRNYLKKARAYASATASASGGQDGKGGTANPSTADPGTASATYNIEASDNSVKLSGNAKAHDIYGGCNYIDRSGAYAYAYADAEVSRVGTGGTAIAGTASTTYNIEASNNSVKLSGNAKAHDIYGGCNYIDSSVDGDYAYAYALASVSATADDPVVSKGGTAAAGTATNTYNAKALNNIITLTNAQAHAVYGGCNYFYIWTLSRANTNAKATGDKAVAGTATPGTAQHKYNVEASENKVYLYGGSFKDASVYGGCSSVKVRNEDLANVTGTSKACNNKVVLNPYDGAAPDLEGAVLWGWRFLVNGKDADAGTVSGNTLELNQVKNVKASNIKNFDKLVFTLPAMTAGDAVLTLTDENGTDISKAEVAVTNEIIDLKGADGGEFKEGDEVVLLKNDNGLTTGDVPAEELAGQPDDATRTVLGQTGISLQYTLEYQNTGKGIVLRCTKTKETRTKTDSGTDQKTTPEHKTNPAQDQNAPAVLPQTRVIAEGAGTVLPQTKAVAEGAAAGLALAGEAANAGIELARNFSPEAGIVAPFVYVQGSSVTHETGSSVHLNAVSLLAGIGTGLDTGAGRLSAGAFFEYGKGSYTTSNSFDNAPSINGDGDAWYMGGGVLARMDIIPTGPGHFYVQGSAHMGQLHNEYDSSDLRDAGGRIAKFDMDSPYYSLHGGLGYVWNITEGHDVDVYGQYIWTRVQNTDDTLTTGDKFEFDDMDSSRVRFGARYTYKGSERFRPYVGAAYEHEFAGSCESTAFGYNVAAPSFEGDTGYGELGITVTPSESLPLSVKLGVQGYVGQKQGVSGNCLVKYEF